MIENPGGELIKEGWKMINGDVPVCIPNPTATPRIAINTTNGTRPADRGFFLLPSVTANTTNNRTKVPMNLALLVQRLDARGLETYFVKETVGRGHVVKLKKCVRQIMRRLGETNREAAK